MYIAWIKSNKPMDMYGNIPEVYESDNAVVFYDDEKKAEKICKYLLPLIDELFDSDLSYGDVSFFEAEKCRKICSVLQTNQKYLQEKIGDKIFGTLYFACSEAVKRNTGVVIEL